jgi:hypothetical protein
MPISSSASLPGASEYTVNAQALLGSPTDLVLCDLTIAAVGIEIRRTH